VGHEIAVGQTLGPFERTTGFGNWNRYAAVNDEFIDVHMSAEAARAAGQPDVFGMGNLRVGYVHAALHEWLDGRGDIARFACQFRALNMLGDVLTPHATVTAVEARYGQQVVELDLGVTNQRGEETMPGTATLVFFGGEPAMPPPPDAAPVRHRTPGALLDADTIDWLGRPLEPLVALPVDANDVRRWAQAIWYPERPPAELVDLDVAAKGPWRALAAPRDFNPYAWNPDSHPEAYPWMRGMGTEPGRRGLNGGQRSWYFAPIVPADVVTQVVTLVDAYEKEGKIGPMLFLVDESRWTNQRGELVKIGQRTTIYH
jgi:acyl dehydratase